MSRRYFKFSSLETKYWEVWFKLIDLLSKRKDLCEKAFTETKSESTGMNEINKKELNNINNQISVVRRDIKTIEKLSRQKNVQLNLPRIKQKYHLTNDEVIILVALLKNELDEKQFLSSKGSFLLGLISEDRVSRLEKLTLLSQESRLYKSNLIIQEFIKGSILHTDFHITEKALYDLVGIKNPLIKDQQPYLENDWFDEDAVPVERLVRFLKPSFSFRDIVLPHEKMALIEDNIVQIRKYRLIFEKWGFGKKMGYGKGLAFLFYGPPGTGKTLTAEAIAYELKRELAVVRYDQIENAFVGVTEKNLTSVFEEVSKKEAVLLFDEADALFSERSVRNSRYDNRIVNLLLSEMERFNGLLILTTNYEPILDWALERRLTLKIKFEFPGYEERLAIWKKLIPEKAPIANDVDFRSLAEYKMSGGNIKNAILNAARKAARRASQKLNPQITQDDFLSAIKMELPLKKDIKVGF